MKINIPNDGTQLIAEKGEEISPIYLENVSTVIPNMELSNLGLELKQDGKNNFYLTGKFKAKGKYPIELNADEHVFKINFTVHDNDFAQLWYLLILFVPVFIYSLSYLDIFSCYLNIIYTKYAIASILINAVVIVSYFEIIIQAWHLMFLVIPKEGKKIGLTHLTLLSAVTVVLAVPAIILSSSNYKEGKYHIDVNSFILALSVFILNSALIYFKNKFIRKQASPT
ncbi:Uncharacterised protein [Kingella potus]|uniref:Uncharacterized protein n=1 Tax=Kingella potus TaxID=265175 RepID=A0A377R049_9NEIS|nr:hypothetical protein [Kingella potus]UOP00966.1 hypothetical protein LVJ84_00680 [Kingella potus]STR00622.1 Uncharacterised protein [Kingella potus]